MKRKISYFLLLFKLFFCKQLILNISFCLIYLNIKWRELLLIYNIIWSLWYSHFLRKNTVIRNFTPNSSAFYADIFLLSSFLPQLPVLEPPEDVSVRLPHVVHTRCTIKKGREIQGQITNEIILRRCAWNYSGAWFIVSIPDPNPIPSLAPFPKGTVEVNSTNHMGILYCSCNCDLTVDLDTHVWNGFLHFYCHESTKNCEYN